MNKLISKQKIESAEKQIQLLQRQIDYDTRDYPIDYLIQNYRSQIFFAPAYQRKGGVWDPHRKERFIESLLLGYPIPLLFLSDTTEGKLEIVDGLQRISTLSEFINNEFPLKKLDKLTKLTGFEFQNLPIGEQRRLKNESLRVIVLRKNTDRETRIDLFNRINTSSLQANDAEIRTGSEQLNPLMKLIERLSNNKTFLKLINLPQSKLDRKENVEFTSRFFAYSYNYKKFTHIVRIFVDDFIRDFGSNFDKVERKKLSDEFTTTFNFIEKYYPKGVFKNNRNQTPRVRFEAISVGTNLALQKMPNLTIIADNITQMVTSNDFKNLTTSDASNSKKKVIARIDFVKEFLLEHGNE